MVIDANANTSGLGFSVSFDRMQEIPIRINIDLHSFLTIIFGTMMLRYVLIALAMPIKCVLCKKKGKSPKASKKRVGQPPILERDGVNIASGGSVEASILQCSPNALLLAGTEVTFMTPGMVLWTVADPDTEGSVCNNCGTVFRTVVSIEPPEASGIFSCPVGQSCVKVLTEFTLLKDIMDPKLLKAFRLQPEVGEMEAELLFDCPYSSSTRKLVTVDAGRRGLLERVERCTDYLAINADGSCKYTNCYVGKDGYAPFCFSCSLNCNNGCGSGWNEILVPDTMIEFDFREPCCLHDHCYSTNAWNEKECNNFFLLDLQAQCRNQPWYYKLIKLPLRAGIGLPCEAYAIIYFLAVSAAGKDAAAMAQREQQAYERRELCIKPSSPNPTPTLPPSPTPVPEDGYPPIPLAYCSNRNEPRVIHIELGKRVCGGDRFEYPLNPNPGDVVDVDVLLHSPDSPGGFIVNANILDYTLSLITGIEELSLDRTPLLVNANSQQGDCGVPAILEIVGGYDCGSYDLTVELYERVNFNMAGTGFQDALVIALDDGVYSSCGSINNVKYCNAAHYWTLQMNKGDELYVNSLVEGNGLSYWTFYDGFQTEIASSLDSNLKETENVKANFVAPTTGTHYVRLRQDLAAIKFYAVAFRVQRSSLVV
ncbi:hypothetical protein IV203_023264 [Nitzschia inconspicua]|uniref:Uncharacterized protein n=1 Tax=Nitzschia inconspicua TaxID=303405 RepID=A0A9K3KE39_9STRA|nr:hypothetical protein IV203_023264 [Nitzschia inconspicua]